MELGTLFYKNKLYNLNFMKIDQMKLVINTKICSREDAIFRRAYEYRMTQLLIDEKVHNQLNSINFEIVKVNNKFITLPKNYNLIKNEIDNIENEYIKILKKISYKYDEKIEKVILKLLKLENRLLKNKKNDSEKISKINDEIKLYYKKLNELSEEKIKRIQGAMESEEKRLSTKIVKPKNFEKITRFFANKFNTYNVISKNILNPINQRIDDYLSKNISLYDIEVKEFILEDFEDKLNKIVKQK